MGDDASDDDGDDDNTAGTITASLMSQPTPTGASKKKKRKKSKKKKKKHSQSSPPRIPLSDLFPTGQYPVGEIQSYKTPVVENTARTTAEEARIQSRRHLQDDSFLND